MSPCRRLVQNRSSGCRADHDPRHLGSGVDLKTPMQGPEFEVKTRTAHFGSCDRDGHQLYDGLSVIIV